MNMNNILSEGECSAIDRAFSILVTLKHDDTIETDYFVIRKKGGGFLIETKNLKYTEYANKIVGKNASGD